MPSGHELSTLPSPPASPSSDESEYPFSPVCFIVYSIQVFCQYVFQHIQGFPNTVIPMCGEATS